MKRVVSFVAKILLMGMVAFPVCPMMVQAQGRALMSHQQMHGMPVETHQQVVETQMHADACCASTTKVIPAVATRNDFSVVALSCAQRPTCETAVTQIHREKRVVENTGPPDKKFETRSANKRE